MGNRQSQKNLTKMKSLGYENIFSSPCAVKAQKLRAVGLFKVESVLNKNKKSKFQRKFGKFNSFLQFLNFYLTLTQQTDRLYFEQTHSSQFLSFYNTTQTFHFC